MSSDQERSAALVRVSVTSPVATLTLDSPHNRNALSSQLMAELTELLKTADESSDVRMIVLTHTGTTFCAGVDLGEAVNLGMQQSTRSLLALLRTVVGLSTPVIAVVRGHARAGGLGLIGACDLALASDTSTFAFTESRLGLAPAVISLTTSSRLSERDAALKYLTGNVFGGREAADSGLVTESVADAALDGVLATMLGELAKASPQGLRETKKLMNQAMLRRFDAEGEMLVELSARLFASAEAREAMTAFRARTSKS